MRISNFMSQNADCQHSLFPPFIFNLLPIVPSVSQITYRLSFYAPDYSENNSRNTIKNIYIFIKTRRTLRTLQDFWIFSCFDSFDIRINSLVTGNTGEEK